MAKTKKNTEQVQNTDSQNSVEKPILGINQNTLEEDSIANYLTYALNTINESDSGNMLVLAKENSNYLTETFTSTEEPNKDFKVCGFIKMDNDEVCIFLTTLDGTSCEFGILNINGQYETIVNLPDLKFNLNNYITGVYRIRLGCERVIYWVEKNALNPIRYFNFSRPEEFQDNSGNYDIEMFNLFYNYTRPIFQEINLLNGGALPSGSYNLSVQYLDNNYNGTPWIYTTEPIPVFINTLVGQEYFNVIGSSNHVTDSFGGTVVPTTRSIQAVMDNLDINFPYYRLALIQASSFNKEVTKILVSPPISIDQNSFIFTGTEDTLNNEVDESVLQIKQSPINAEILVQQDNRLLAGRIKGVPYDLCSFQKYASKIATGYVSKLVSATDYTAQGNFKNSSTYWLDKTFQGFEVYAVGIVYVYPNYETPVFHIPGRPINTYYNIATNTVVAKTGEDDLMSWNTGEVIPFTLNTLPPVNPDVYYNAHKDVQRWQLRDVSDRYVGSTTMGYMSYHENKQGVYEDKDVCNGTSDYWGKDFAGNDLVNTPIRHHRFPSRNKEPHIELGIAQITKEVLNIRVSFPDEGDSDYSSGSIYPNNFYIVLDYRKDGIAQPTLTTDPISILSVDETNGYIQYIDNSLSGIGSFSDYILVGIYDYVTNDDITDLFDTEFFTTEIDVSTNTSTIRILGFQFSNIEYPDSRIIGHYFVVGVRDEFNRTILDAGAINNMRSLYYEGEIASAFGYLCPPDNKDKRHLFGFLPRFNFNQELLPATYLRVERVFNNAISFATAFKRDASGAWIGTGTDIVMVQRPIYFQDTTDANCGEVYPITKKQEFTGLSSDFNNFITNKKSFNLSYTNTFLGLETYRDYFPITGNAKEIPYTTMCVNRDVHSNLSNITYIRTHPNINVATSTSDSELVYGGDTIISRWLINNGALYKMKGSGWSIIAWITAAVALAAISILTFGVGTAVIAGSLLTLTSVLSGVALTLALGGTLAASIGLTNELVSQNREAYTNRGLGVFMQDDDIEIADNLYSGLSKKDTYANEFIENFYVESCDVNIELREECLATGNLVGKILKKPYVGNNIGDITPYTNYLLNQWFYFDPDEVNPDKAWIFKGGENVTPEIYHDNPDFVRRNLQTTYFALPDTYDCCSPCMETFKNRIHYSEQSFQEEAIDHYRTFLPYNYIDLEGSGGELTNLFIKGKNLFAHCTESLWQIPANLQTQITSELVTYIGTGEYLSIPPIQVINDKDSPCGSQHRLGTTLSKNGDLFISERERKIYLFGHEGQPIPLNLEGIKDWSEENIPLKLLESNISSPYYESIKEYFNDTPYHPFGIGFISMYDSKYNRFIITKKDYIFLQTPINKTVIYNEDYYFEDAEIYELGDFIYGYSGGHLYFKIIEIVKTVKTIRYIVEPILDIKDEPTMFQDYSWTLSYSMYSKSWISWHSYTPEIYISNSKTFYSILNTPIKAQLYQHNWKYDYCTFYGEYKPHILEMVFKNPIQNFTWEYIEIHSKSRLYNNISKQFLEDRFGFFDEVIFYNQRQSSGLKTLTFPQKNIGQSYMSNQIKRLSQHISAIKTEESWFINDIRDYTINPSNPLFTEQWSEIFPYYPIDKVSNEANINHNKNWFELESLRSKFLKIRLISNTNKDNSKKQLLTTYIIKYNTPSY